jgi:phosphatidylinositol phosphate synthase
MEAAMAGSLLTPEQRAGFRARVEPLARVFGRVGLTPNALTVIGLLIACVAAITAGATWWAVTGLLVVFGGAFDMFDGALARATGKASVFGAFLDSTLDRAGEAVIYVGIVYGLAASQQTTGAVLAAAAMAAAFMVSYARAKAESLGFTGGSGMANVGVAPREVRIVILMLGLLITGIWGDIRPLEISLGLIALLATITAAQRIVVVRHQSIERESAKEIR